MKVFLGIFSILSTTLAMAVSDYTHLLTQRDFSNYAKSNLSTQYVKFVLELNNTKSKLYFFNSKKYLLHVDFLKQGLHKTEDRKTLYQQAMENKGRRYYFGALLRKSTFTDSLDLFQIRSTENVEIAQVKKIADSLVKGLKYKVTLKYFPDASQWDYITDEKVQSDAEKIGLTIYMAKKQNMTVYSSGLTVGRIKITTSKAIAGKKYQPKPTDILVLDNVSAELPPVRGVISSSPSSPNSHVALLAEMLSIPFVHISAANQRIDIKRLDGRTVFFKPYDGRSKTLQSPYTLIELSQNDFAEWDKKLRNRFPQIQVPLNKNNLSSIMQLPLLTQKSSLLSTETCGAKAANAHRLNQILGSKNSLIGFCVPFFFFESFLDSNQVGNESLKQYIERELKEITKKSSIDDIAIRLSEIRQQISLAKVNLNHLKLISKRTLEVFANDPQISKVRFRSSSNAEDDERFNGAGLYESKGVKLKHFRRGNTAKIEKALKTVWSSVYGLRAFIARRQFGIDETRVKMGILVNQSFQETARGVSLCEIQDKKLTCKTEGFPGGDLKVTHPAQGKVSEISSMSDKIYRVHQRTSELPLFTNLFSEREYKHLFLHMKKIYHQWRTKVIPGFHGKLDFEWKRMQSPTGLPYMIIKQVRIVPEPLKLAAKIPRLLIDGKRKWFTSFYHNHLGPMPLVNYREFQVHIPAMVTFDSVERMKKDIRVLVSDYLNKNTPVKISKIHFSKQGWKKSYDGGEINRHILDLSLEHQHIEDLKLRIEYSIKRNKNRIVSDNFATVDQLEISSIIPQSHFSYLKKLGSGLGKGPLAERVSEFPYVLVGPAETHTFCKAGQIIAKVELDGYPPTIYRGDGNYPLTRFFVAPSVLPRGLKVNISRSQLLRGMGDSHAEEPYHAYHTFSAAVEKRGNWYFVTLSVTDLGKFARVFDEKLNLIKETRLDEACSSP